MTFWAYNLPHTLNCIWISYLSFKAVLALPKMAHFAQTHKSISFIWIVWSTLYVYLWANFENYPLSTHIQYQFSHSASQISQFIEPFWSSNQIPIHTFKLLWNIFLVWIVFKIKIRGKECDNLISERFWTHNFTLTQVASTTQKTF